MDDMDTEEAVPDNGSLNEEKFESRAPEQSQELILKCEIRPEGMQVPAPPAEAGHPDFWMNMQMRFNSQTNEMKGMVGVLDRTLESVKGDLKNEIKRRAHAEAEGERGGDEQVRRADHAHRQGGARRS